MKKSLKTQMKKTISLFLAVLMILSCWVWVAPEKAEAANDYTEGWYYVIAKVYLQTYCEAAYGNLYLSTTSVKTGENGNLNNIKVLSAGTFPESSEGGWVTLYKGYVDGFPYQAAIDMTIPSSFTGRKIRLEQFSVYVGKDESSCNNLVLGGSSSNSYEESSGWTDASWSASDFTINRNDGVYPYIDSATTPKAQSKTIPSVGSAGVEKTDEFLPEYWDQYGVKWVAPIAPNYIISANSTGQTDIANEENGFYIVENETTGKVHTEITAKMQDGFRLTGTEGTTKDYFLIASVTNSKGIDVKAIQKITVTYPTYSVTVNPNGGSMTMSEGDPSSEKWTNTGVFGKEKMPYPTGDATREGYTFAGFWTVSQPTTGNASINAYEADFAVPTDEDTFDYYCGLVKDEDGDRYVKYNGVNYYNAEKQWDKATSRTVSGNAEYHSWWIAKDIPVKFYDIDGKYLSTVTYKYGMKLSDETKTVPTPTLDTYTAGAFTYTTFTGVWRNINGTLVGGEFIFGHDGLMSYTLTPTYQNKEYKDTYNITFVKPDGSKTTNTYKYRHILAGAEIVTSVAMPEVLSKDLAYSYKFKGWTTQSPSSGNYIVVDNDDSVVLINEDWIVREDTTYYPVFERTIKEYAVLLSYVDTTGNRITKALTIKYGTLFTTPEDINTIYAKDGKSHNLLKWTYTNPENATAELNANKSIIFNSENFKIEDRNLVGGSPITIVAIYDSGTYKPYDIVFKYKDSKGNEYKLVKEVTHGETITQEIVDSLIGAVPVEYDDGDFLYNFLNSWRVVEGAASADTYETTALNTIAPQSNLVFEAIYDEGVPFYTVTYIDGAAKYTERVLKGSKVPAWMLSNGQQYVPKDYESATGIYKFVGWFDEAQTDEDCKKTNGIQYTTDSTVNGNLTLYPQYIYEAYKFKIEFVGYNGEVLESGEFEVGESFKGIHDLAEEEAKNRPADETYSYTFIGWDNSVGNFICDGKAIKFTARYRSNYIYYKANWYDAKDGNLAATTQHTYQSSVYNPSVDLEIPAGKVFDGWYYLDEGVEKPFERGMIIKGDMNFYAKYNEAPKTYKVTTVVNGNPTEYTVAENGTADAIIAPEYIYAGDKHQKFVGWYTDSGFNTAFDLSTKITSDITVYAKYETKEHNFIIDEIISDPTYYTEGEIVEYCVCDKNETTHTVKIPMLTDTVAPTGTIQLGSHKWSSTDKIGAAATDGDEVSIYANADTDIIITVNDTGDKSPEYNPGGIGKGIKIIRAFVSKGVYGPDSKEEDISEIKTVYTDETEELNNVANYVVRLGSYEGLVDGETYIVYYYVNDKANNALNAKVRTAKFVYDISAPELTIVGNSNASTLQAGTPTYCGAATVTGIEAGATVTVNGKEVTVTDGTYAINTPDNYIITITDRAGNKTSKKIKVVAEHNYITTTVNSTCIEDGYKKVKCAICGGISEDKIYKAPGHEWTYSFVPAACDEAGYNINTCDVCGETEKIYEVDGKPVQPKLGHIYPMDGENIVYSVVTDATCVSKGLKIANCTYCGEGTLSEEIPVDSANGHNYGSVKTQKPTCTEEGKTYQRCKYCYVILEGQTIEATGHQETYSVISNAATCNKPGTEAKHCKKCDVKVGEDIVIPATGKHIAYVTEQKAPTGTEDGYIKYACQTCTEWSKIEYIDKLELYNVTFVSEDGKTVITEIIDEVIGTTITEDVLKGENGASLIPVKASDNEYDYAFSGWTDADGKTVKLPFEITGDITLKATYKATRKIYTHKFMVPTKWNVARSAEGSSYAQFGDNIIGYYGDVNKKPNAVPKFTDADPEEDKRLKQKYTFTFLGWSTTGAKNDIVEDFVTYQMTGDAEFVAVFEAELNEYNVIFSKKGGELLWMTTVEADGSVKYGGEDPSYYDDNYHYTFKQWLLGTTEYAYDATIDSILADTKLVADYDREAHGANEGDFTTIYQDSEGNLLTWVSTCYKEGQLTEQCKCGYIKTTTLPKTDHTWEEQPNGDKVCTNDGCGLTVPAETKFVTITFKFDGKEFSTQVAEGEEYTFTAPVKESTASHDYPFTAWMKDGEEYSKDKTITVTAGSTDETYVVSYGETIRKYRVTYFDWNHDVFVDKDDKVCTGEYEYGSIIPAKPEKEPSRAYDRDFHYEFTGWSVTSGTTANGVVEGDIEIYATYNVVKHDFVESSEPATCNKVGGKTMTCKGCGYSYATGSVIPMIPHTVGKVLENTEATIYNDGVYRYICATCGEEQKESKPMLAKTDIAIRVYDGEGKKAAYATVKVYYSVVENGETILVEYKTKTGYSHLTNAEGFVNVVVPAEYKGWRVSIWYDGGSYSGELKTGGEENIFGAPKVETPESDCSCTCHKGRRPGDGLFAKLQGNIFRFFQKIFAIFGAKPCCYNQEL